MSKFVVSDTVRWKVVKIQHNLTDDMKVAKMLLDCYDAIISGCLQWRDDRKKTRLPFGTSENGWKVLEEVMYMMEWNDRQYDRWCSLTMWNDDDDDDKVEGKEENEDQEEQVRGQDETVDKCKGKSSMQTVKKNETKKRDLKKRDNVDNHFVDISLVVDGNNDDDNNGDNDDDDDNDWTPQETEVTATNKSSGSRSISPRQKAQANHQYSPKAYKKPRKGTRAVEFLSNPNQTKVIECTRCLHRLHSVDDFKEHFASHTQAAIVDNKVRKVADMELEEIPLFATILVPCPDCCELQASNSLEMHRTNKHFQRNCEVCGDHFTSFGGWSRHMKAHKVKETGIKPHVCDKCGKSFTLIGTLTQHKKLHSIDRSYICEVCGKGFKLSTRLKRHMSIHSDKSLACEFCNKTFNYKFNLKTHLRTHTHERPFQCSVCLKSYSHNNSLKVHAKSEHGIDMEFGCQALKEFEDLSSETSILLARQQKAGSNNMWC